MSTCALTVAMLIKTTTLPSHRLYLKSGSKRFTTEKLDKNLIVAYDSAKPDKCLLTINTTAKDFIAEFEITGEDLDDLIVYLQHIRK
jgi:hypothetical protein